MASIGILYDITGSRKSKMAAVKPEVLISRLETIATPFQWLTPIFVVQQLNGTIANTARCRLFKMAAAKPEVLKSQLTYQIAMPFQRLTPILRVQEVHGVIGNTARCDFLDPGQLEVGRCNGAAILSRSLDIRTSG